MADLIGAGPELFVTQGERKAAGELRQLPKNWLVICNKVLPTSDGRSYEIDFIIVGERWIFLLDEKSWKGRIRGNDDQWVRADGSSERSPLAKADYVAKILAYHISRRVPLLKDGGHFVRGGVLLSSVDQLPQIHDPRAANGIFLLADIRQRLQALDKRDGNSFVKSVRDKIRDTLVDLSYRPKIPHTINQYLVKDSTVLRPGTRLLRATVEHDNGEARWLMMYDLGRDPLAVQEHREFSIHELKVLQKLHATGLVPEIMDYFTWSEDFLVVPIVPPPASYKSLSAYPQSETHEEFLQELQLAAACFKGLDQIHASKILHRALSPDALYVHTNSSPKVLFTNFFAARMAAYTIAPALDALALEDPYASVDIAIGYEYATTDTDTFSLALIWLERLSGLSISRIRSTVESSIDFPDTPRWSFFLSKEYAGELADLFRQILTPEKNIAIPSAKEVSMRLSDLLRRLKTESVGDIGRLLLDKRYKVEKFLGQGTMARTYLASYTDYEGLGVYVLKQFQPAIAYQQAIAEYKVLFNINSKYFPRIFEIYRPEDDVQIKMEYIPGPTLQQVERDFPWQIERWWPFAQELMNAVELLEQHQILHRDIKPANIILHEQDNHPVLIDFGLAVNQGVAVKPEGTPLYLPPEASTAVQPPLSTDRYALCIILFKALTGYLPFLSTHTGQRQLFQLEQLTGEKMRRIARVLLQGLSPNPIERPTSVIQLRNELQTAVLAVEEPADAQTQAEQVNYWVEDLRSLYRNSTNGNVNNRGLDTAFVRETYVPTALDAQLLPAIFTHHPKVVFLSGNPGDGKTAFLEQVRQALKSKKATLIEEDPSGWEWHYDGHTFRCCYDASEAHGDLSADEQLMKKLKEMKGLHPPDAALTVLIAINDGRLADYFSHYQREFAWLSHQVEVGEKEALEKRPVWLIDLKRRSFVFMPETGETSLFKRLLGQFVAEEKWDICSQCAAHVVCPIYNNALALRHPRRAQRLEFLFLLLHLRRQRHMTIRDIRSSLAYLLTGNKSCQQIHALRKGQETDIRLVDLSYWQTMFAPLDMSDEFFVDIMAFDPGRFPQPHLDRFLHFHQTLADGDLRGYLFYNNKDLPLQLFQREKDWIAAFKRRLYFESRTAQQEKTSYLVPSIRWRALIPYQYANTFMKLLAKKIAPSSLLEPLAQGILRSEGIISDIPSGTLTVKVSASEQQQLLVLKQIPLDAFELSIEAYNGTSFIETIPEIVVLKHRSGIPRLEITLDMFELLMRMAEGLQPSSPEFQPLLEDLALFKNTLLLGESVDLILIESQQSVYSIMQKDGKIMLKRMEGDR